MKKLLIFLLLIMVLFYTNKTSKPFSLTDYFSGEYISYSDNATSENSISLGFCYINNNEKSSYTIGESITSNNLEISSAIKTLKANVIKTEYLENGTTVIYAYSPLISKSVTLNNNMVNIQIATNNTQTTIGWPLILGSF